MDGSTNPASAEGATADADVNRGVASGEIRGEATRAEALPSSESTPASAPGFAPGPAPAAVTLEDRIGELRAQSLRESNPLISALSTAGSDLLTLQQVILSPITQMIRTDADQLGAIGDAAPHLGLALKVGSQSLQLFAFAERLQRQKGVPPSSE